MAEHLPTHEHDGTSNEVYHDNPESAQAEHLEKLKAEAREASQGHTKEAITELEQAAGDEAKHAHETNVEDTAPSGGGAPAMYGTHRQLKKQSYDRTMKQVRSKLPVAERSFSKLVHQPVINSVSELSGKTALRPSGVLGGSICAFLGSLGLLWAAKTYGFTYNYLVLFFFFVGGFFLGLLLEAVIRLFFRKHPS
jgi:hypothetical protein